MADYSNRIQRLLHIITLVQGDRSYTPARFAHLFGMTERSVFRDMNDLRAAGVPIDFDPEIDGYVIRGDFFLRPTEFSLDEALALCLLATQVRENEQLPQTKPAAKAIQKLRCNLPGTFREELEQLMPHVTVALARRENEGNQDVFEKMRTAIANRRSLICAYETPRRKDDTPYRFDPYALYFGQRAWYVIGKRHTDGEIRTLKLSRFVQCRSTDQPFQIPDDFTVETYFGNAWRMMRDDTRYTIQLWFSPAVAETVADTWWHATQQVDDHDDGSITTWFEVDGLEEIVWWILSYGPHCKVIEPAALRERVISLIRETARSYVS